MNSYPEVSHAYVNYFGKNLEEVLDPNDYDRIFVAGDLHGAYEKLMQALCNVNFDTNRDILVLAGDLIDRGPSSLSCLRLIEESWVRYVPGNHEQMFVSYMAASGDVFDRSFEMNGGDWITTFRRELNILSVDECAFLAEKICKAPRMLTFEGLCHVIHAELYASHFIIEDLTEDTYQKYLKPLMMIQTIDGDCSFWGRRIFNRLYGRFHSALSETDIALMCDAARPFEKMNLIVSGHTATREAVQIGQNLLIDTKAWEYGSPLTLYEPKTGLIHETWIDSSMLYVKRHPAKYKRTES